MKGREKGKKVRLLEEKLERQRVGIGHEKTIQNVARVEDERRVYSV